MIGAYLLRVPFLQVAHARASLDVVAELVPQHLAHLLTQRVLVQMAEHAAKRAVVQNDAAPHRRVDAVLAQNVQVAVYIRRVEGVAVLNENTAV